MYTVGIITISDKGAAGQREDKSGPKIKELLPKDKYDVVSYKIIPDEREHITTVSCNVNSYNIICFFKKLNRQDNSCRFLYTLIF